MTLYLIDANVLIRAHADYYPIDRIKPFWEWLLGMAEADRVKMPREIYDGFCRVWRQRNELWYLFAYAGLKMNDYNRATGEIYQRIARPSIFGASPDGTHQAAPRAAAAGGHGHRG